MTSFERHVEPYRLLRPPRLRSLDDGERRASYLELLRVEPREAVTAS